MPREFREIARRLLPDGPIAASRIGFPPPWRYAVVVDRAVRSQFDILVDSLRAGVGVPDGLVCVAGSGEGLHGQRGRPWAAVRGNLHLSVFLSPRRLLNEIVTGLTVLPAVSLLQTLDSIAGLENRAGIRWVSDIVIDGSKLAGYLVHTQSAAGRMTGAVIGIGLNVEEVPSVAPTVFVPSVTALCEHVSDPGACSRPEVLRRLLCFLARNYQKLVAGRAAELVEFYRQRSVVLGRPVVVYPDVQGDGAGPSAAGTVAGIGDRLELILAGGGEPVARGRLASAPACCSQV